MLIARHRVPADVFTLLAHGRADARAMGLLRAGRLSKQVLLIRAVLDAARAHRGAVIGAGLADAVELMDKIQRHSPVAAAEVMGNPLVGAWAAYCLRRLRHPTESSTPLWVDLGHLAAVAAAAAIHAGVAVDLPVPMRRGEVFLPTLGRARLRTAANWGVATVRGDAGNYVITGQHGTVAVPEPPTGSAADWEAVHRLAVPARGQALQVVLDDLDPYRSCHGLSATDRLAAPALARWRSHLADAWELLANDHPERVAELSTGPITIVPVAPDRSSHTNATARDSPGAMLLTPQPNPFQLALSMVHEFQHSKLGALLDLVELYDPADRRRFYSPWRADPRRVGGLLQGAYAFLAVATFWYRYAARPGRTVPHPLAEYELARTRAQVGDALRDLAASGALTGPGTGFVAGLHEALTALLAHPVTATADRLARLVRTDHQVGWRLRNSRPEPETLNALATAWRSAAARPTDQPPSRLVPGAPATYAEEPRHELARQSILGTQGARSGPDAALLAGDYEAAAGKYLAGIAAEPGRTDLWTGLVLARRLGPAGMARAYTIEPELLVALHRRLSASGEPADPDRLAAWLGT